ncbi:MAG TPA: hypothetical protein PKY10_09850 [Lentisphaeria bacterium]|nr:hypothetical protein [Lentisphaeria bacterium]
MTLLIQPQVAAVESGRGWPESVVNGGAKMLPPLLWNGRIEKSKGHIRGNGM